MSSGSENNALVEIALALSMAFFSLMVLTMVSMSAGVAQKTPGVVVKMAGLSIKQAAASSLKNSNGPAAHIIKPEKLAVYYNDRFYDADLNPLSVSQTNAQKFKFLAVAPDLSMQQAISVRNRFGGTGLIVTTLNDAWLKTLKEKIK